MTPLSDPLPITPFTHPDTGEKYLLIGGWIRHPGDLDFQRSAWMLQ